MKIKVKYHSDVVKPIEMAHPGEWIDLKAAEGKSMSACSFHLIPLGVSIKIPDGYEAIMAPRSSTFKNYGILQANGIGVIDNAYCGEDDQWFWPCWATRDTGIPKGAKIAQFRIQPINPVTEIEEVETMEDASRGGFGSTGV